MKRLRKYIFLILFACISFTMFTACSSSMAYTFKIENGDNIRVSLDTSYGHKLRQSDGVFYIEDDGEILSQGIFMLEYDCTQYFENAKGSDGVTILDEGIDKGNEYLFYKYDDGTNVYYYYIIRVADTSTGVGLINEISQESAKTCYHLLTFAND